MFASVPRHEIRARPNIRPLSVPNKPTMRGGCRPIIASGNPSPEVSAARNGKGVTWMNGGCTAELDASRAIWRVRIEAMLTYDERKIVDSAYVAAWNLLEHFDLRWCRGIDHEPYSEIEMKRFSEKRSFLG